MPTLTSLDSPLSPLSPCLKNTEKLSAMCIFRVPHEPSWNNYLTMGHAEAKGKPACFQSCFQQQGEMFSLVRIKPSRGQTQKGHLQCSMFMCKASQVILAYLHHGPYPVCGDK